MPSGCQGFDSQPPEARAKEGLKKDVLANGLGLEGKSLVTVGMTGLGKSPGKIYLYHCVSPCDLNHSASHESIWIPQSPSCRAGSGSHARTPGQATKAGS